MLQPWRIVLVATMLAAPLSFAQAADVTILSGGAVKSGITAVTAAFEKATGDKIVADYAPMAPLLKKLEAGATPDVVFFTADVMAEVKANGWIVPDSVVEVGRVEIGVAIPENAVPPDISTPEAFKATLLKAKAIAMINPANGTSGKHLAKVFEDLGIAEALKPKLKLADQGYAVAPVGTGEADIGLQQITEILPVKGVKLAGPVPAALQKETIYLGAIGSKAKNAEAAKRLLAFLRTTESRAAFAKQGYKPEK